MNSMTHKLQTIATACMFLACKAEDNLRPLRDVTIVAYEMIYKWDPSVPERIRQRVCCVFPVPNLSKNDVLLV